MRNAYNILVEKSVSWSRLKLSVNVDCSQLPQNKARRQCIVNMGNDLPEPMKDGEFRDSWTKISFSERVSVRVEMVMYLWALHIRRPRYYLCWLEAFWSVSCYMSVHSPILAFKMSLREWVPPLTLLTTNEKQAKFVPPKSSWIENCFMIVARSLHNQWMLGCSYNHSTAQWL